MGIKRFAFVMSALYPYFEIICKLSMCIVHRTKYKSLVKKSQFYEVLEQKVTENKILSFKILGFFFLRTFCAKNYRTLFLKKTSENFLVNGGESF